MSVKLTTRQVGDVTVVDVAGRITLGEGSATLRDAMRDMVSKNQKKILPIPNRWAISKHFLLKMLLSNTRPLLKKRSII